MGTGIGGYRHVDGERLRQPIMGLVRYLRMSAGSLAEFSSERDIDAGDSALLTQPSWCVKGEIAIAHMELGKRAGDSRELEGRMISNQQRTECGFT